MTTMPIIVYGNGDLYYQYFEAIVRSFGNTANVYSSLIRLTTLLGGMTVLFSYVLKRDVMDMVRWMGRVYVVIYILFLPRVTVEIIDNVSSPIGKPYAVANVPLGLAAVASFTSVISDNITQLLEMNFSMPDDLKYHRHGMVFASEMVRAVSQFEITDSRFDENMQGFINQCMFYDVLLHKYSLDDLMQSGDLWNLASKNASPARAFVYRDSSGQTDIKTCRESIELLKNDWKGAIDAAKLRYSTRLVRSAGNPADTLTKYIGMSYGYLTGLSGQADRIMRQNMMANAIERGVLRMGATVNAAAAMQSYAYTRAMEQKRLTNQTVGDMAAYWLPLIRNVLEMVLYGCFIFVILLGVFPFGARTIQSWGLTLLWLKLWPPLYAIVNLTVSCYAQRQSMGATGGVLSLQSMPGLLQINADMAGLAGYLSMSVPAISGGLLWGMNHAFLQMSQYVGGVVQSTAGSGATEAVTGNISLGNTSFGNQSAFNTSANHFDTAMRFSGSQMSLQGTDGSRTTFMADGSHVLDMSPTVSNLGSSVDSGLSVRNSQSESASHAMTTAKQSAAHYGESIHAGMRDLFDISHHMGNTDASSDGWNVSTTAGVSDAAGKVNQTVQHIADRLGISTQEAKNIASRIYADGKMGLSAGIGSGGGMLPGKIGASLSGSAGGSHSVGRDSRLDQSEQYSKAKDIMDNENFAHNVDVIQRSARDGSLRVSSEEGSRKVIGMSGSFDKAETYRSDTQASLNLAESFQNSASHGSESSFVIRSQDNNQFQAWMEKQPNRDGHGTLGPNGARAALEDPYLRQRYFERYSADQSAKMSSPYGSLMHSEGSIQTRYEQQAESIERAHSKEQMKKHWKDGNKSREKYAVEKNILSDKTVNYGVRDRAEHSISNNKNEINEKQNTRAYEKQHAEAVYRNVDSQAKERSERSLIKSGVFGDKKLEHEEL